MAEQGRGRYLLVNVILRRTRALYAGDKPLVKAPDGADAGDVAYREIMGGRLKVTPRKAPPKLIDLAKQSM